jgi:hypothetical protein
MLNPKYWLLKRKESLIDITIIRKIFFLAAEK